MSDAVDPFIVKQLEFDPAALHRKYQEERAKRIREDGKGQYVKLAGRFAWLAEDPNADPDFVRDPVVDHADVVIIGGGYGGLLSGAELRRVGVENIRIIERGADLGGTWYWNRYPGAACDVESYIYLPLLEEVGGTPANKYARAPEIWEHTKKIARKFDLYRDALLQTVATDLTWSEDTQRWTVRTNRGDVIQARYVVSAIGPQTEPKLPGLPGIDTFKGQTFHTSRWNFDYTGGDNTGNLTKLADKRVAIIGTGATAIQCVPHLGRWAKHFYVVQRTPSSIHVRDDRPTDAEWFASLPPGWQKERMENFTAAFGGEKVEVDLVDDEWTRSFFDATDEVAGGDVAPHQLANYRKMEHARARIDREVLDEETREGLKPWYNFFCKRPCFHDDYLATFNRENVTLVNTDGGGVERIDETGLWVAGEHYAVDCIIFSTGFEVGTPFKSRAGFVVHGRGGQTLEEHWRDGFRSMHGIHIHGFPNFFHMGGLEQAGLTANFAHMLTEQTAHLGYVFKEASGGCTNTIEVTKEGEESWVSEIVRVATENSIGAQNQQFQEECTPGYYNNEGKPSQVAIQNGPYGLGFTAFYAELKRWREAGGLPGLSTVPSE